MIYLLIGTAVTSGVLMAAIENRGVILFIYDAWKDGLLNR